MGMRRCGLVITLSSSPPLPQRPRSCSHSRPCYHYLCLPYPYPCHPYQPRCLLISVPAAPLQMATSSVPPAYTIVPPYNYHRVVRMGIAQPAYPGAGMPRSRWLRLPCGIPSQYEYLRGRTCPQGYGVTYRMHVLLFWVGCLRLYVILINLSLLELETLCEMKIERDSERKREGGDHSLLLVNYQCFSAVGKSRQNQNCLLASTVARK